MLPSKAPLFTQGGALLYPHKPVKNRKDLHSSMQNQKTDPVEWAKAEDLPALSDREQKLIENIAAGDDNSQAYRKAYEATGYSPPALRVKACRKVAEPHIQAHLVALRSVGLANNRLTLEGRLEAELAFAQRAEAAGNFGAAGGAYDRLNKLMGLYIERLEVTAQDPLDSLRQIAQVSPELARQMAAAQGIDWPTEQRLTEH